MFKILSIDGGGIRGVIPAVILHYIEEQMDCSIAEKFDLIVGTSTGGILAAGLTVPDELERQQAKYSAADLLKLYEDHGKSIFDTSLVDVITSAHGLLDETYGHANLEALLEDYMGDVTLEDVVKPVVITSYDIERRQPYFFKSRYAGDQPDRNHYLRDVCRATSAAPTYFEPKETYSLSDEPVRRVLVDGGVFVNNPSVSAFVEAQAHMDEGDEILMLSIGTGVLTHPINYNKAKNWGVAGWAKPAFSVMMDGMADAADYHMKHLMPNAEDGDKQRYFRFDKDLTRASDDLGLASAANIAALKWEGEQIIKHQAGEFQRLFDLLND